MTRTNLRDRTANPPASRGAVVAAACLVACVMDAAAGQPRGRSPVAPRRAPPPAGDWDRATAEAFVADAFATLEGPRPAFRPRDAGAGTTDPPNPTAATPGAGLAWSSLVSADTLADEIKDAGAAITKACAKPGDFKGGGFEAAREGFGILAVAFGVIAAYDGDVRWKRDAAAARDTFAGAGAACAGGGDPAYREARAGLEHLEALLAGGAPAMPARRGGEFVWSQAAGRPALMGRVDAALAAMRPAAASRADFERHLDAVRHAAEIVAVIGEVVRQPDFEHHDDDTYRGYAAAMRDAAVGMRKACTDRDHDAARTALDALERSCTDCHGDYRG